MSANIDLSSVEQGLDESIDSELSENAVEDIVTVARSNVIANEEGVVLSTLGYTTGWFYEMERYVNSVLIGPSAGGKTLVQDCTQKMLPEEHVYSTTDASANALTDDPEWDRSLVASMDEYDKVSSEIREFMKSMAGEDGGFTKKRNVEDQDAEGGYSPATIESNALPFQFLYAPSGKKSSIDHELATRMLTIHVEDNKHIREAIGRKEAGHTNIDVPGLDYEYIFDATKTESAIRQRMREQLPTVRGEDDAGYDGRRGGSYAYMPEWCWYACRPIFNRGRTYTNRVYGQVFNLIRSSALLNRPNRRIVETSVNGTTVDAVEVAPQDVANVLSCQKTLLSTTHKLDPRKRAILKAVNKVSGMNDEGAAVLDDVREWLEDNDKPCPSTTTLRSILKDELAEDWFIRVNEGAGPSGSDLYYPRKETGVRPPRMERLEEYAMTQDGEELTAPPNVDLDEPFKDCVDPIRGQPFEDTVSQFRREFAGGATEQSTDAASFMGGSSDDSEDTQATLTGDTLASEESLEPEGEIDSPTARYVYETLQETVGRGGSPFAPHHGVAHYMDVADTEDDDPLVGDVEGTVLDPDHELWDRPDLADGRVADGYDALVELEDALGELQQMDYVEVTTDADIPQGFELVRTAD